MTTPQYITKLAEILTVDEYANLLELFRYDVESIVLSTSDDEFIPSEGAKLLCQFISSTYDPHSFLEIINPEVWSDQELHTRIKELNGCEKLRDKYKFECLEDVGESGNALAINAIKAKKLTELPEIKGLSKVVNAYFDKQLDQFPQCDYNYPEQYVMFCCEGYSASTIENMRQECSKEDYDYPIINALWQDDDLRNLGKKLGNYNYENLPMCDYETYEDYETYAKLYKTAKCKFLRKIGDMFNFAEHDEFYEWLSANVST